MNLGWWVGTDECAELVSAPTRGKARYWASVHHSWVDAYLDLFARREPLCDGLSYIGDVKPEHRNGITDCWECGCWRHPVKGCRCGEETEG